MLGKCCLVPERQFGALAEDLKVGLLQHAILLICKVPSKSPFIAEVHRERLAQFAFFAMFPFGYPGTVLYFAEVDGILFFLGVLVYFVVRSKTWTPCLDGLEGRRCSQLASF